MTLSPTKAEAILKRNYKRYTMKQVDRAIEEIDDILKNLKTFDFKVHGEKVTAVQFFEIKEKLKLSKRFLFYRRAEISKKKFNSVTK